jgi:hypothetical protein
VRAPRFGSLLSTIGSLIFVWLLSTGVVQAASQSDVPVCRGEGKRFALLIGNQDYRGLLNPLANPRRDTQAFANLLCTNGFTVYRYSDLDIAGFDAALFQFANMTRGAQTTLVYYSGHGFAAGGRNWLVPIDAGLDCSSVDSTGNADVNFLQRRLVDLSEGLLGRLDGSGDQIVILDACRTDPLRSCFRGGSGLTLVKGFERQTTSSGRLVMYATQNGKPARDGVEGSDTSPLMTAIVKRLPLFPQRDWLSTMGDVTREVAMLTHQEQVPNLDVNIPPQGCLASDCDSLKGPAVATVTPTPTVPSQAPKVLDRFGPPSSTDQVAPVAQRAVLYDEDPADPKGKQYVGTVVWRTEQIKAAAGQPSDIAVRADIDIPDRKFKMTISFRRNTDASLPASPTADLTFILPPDFAGGGVSNVPGILMKSNEQARGTPLVGLAVKVTDGFFLVGLSNVDADRARNIQLLKERSWFDVPLVYNNQRRGILAIEKGTPGERAYAQALASWGQ